MNLFLEEADEVIVTTATVPMGTTKVRMVTVLNPLFLLHAHF